MTPSIIPYYFTLLSMCVGLIVTGIQPHDRLTWVLEVFPVLIALPILIFTRKSFPLTNMLYCLIAIHAMILMIGGHYTYARVPFGFWMEQFFHFSRNHYDRIGHFAQGFIPAMVLRELLLRTSTIGKSKWLPVLIVASILGVSAFYELFEWWTALILNQSAEDFLGTQGDIWDTQSDMCLAMIGAICALLCLSRWHDKQLRRLGSSC